MADARRPKKADYKIQGSGTTSRDPKSRMAKKRTEAQIENVKAHQIPLTATVDDLIGALNERGAIGVIKATELCNAYVEEFGGLKGLAKLTKEAFDGTDSQHLKAKMLWSLAQLINTVSKTVGEDPVEEMSDEDLMLEAKRMFDKWSRGNGPTGADDGRGVAEVPQTDGGVGQAAVGSVKPVPPPAEDGSVP